MKLNFTNNALVCCYVLFHNQHSKHIIQDNLKLDVKIRSNVAINQGLYRKE